MTTMTTHVPWDDAYATGQPELDAQHRELLALCEAMAARCDTVGEGNGVAAFEDTIACFKALARQHLAAEAALLASHGDAALEDCQAEAEEFEAMVEDVASTRHFDPEELQRFFALWCLGHLRGGVAHRALSTDLPA